MVSMAARANGEKRPLLLGRYEVGKLLGRGNFAKVYHAKNVRTGDEAAIKVMEKEKIFKSGLVAHIKREIAVLRRVRHPNIVQLFEVMATKTKIYFVMEYVRGGELFHRVAKGRLREDVARKYFQQLVSAVNFCHARGVYHRDIKAENLLVDENGDLKVSDFGLSAVADQMRQDGLFHTVSPFQDRTLMSCTVKFTRARSAAAVVSPDSPASSTVSRHQPERRITIPEIMENRWFRKGFRQIKFYVADDKVIHSFDDSDSPPPTPRDEPETEWDDSSSSGSSCSSSPRTPCALTASASSPLLTSNTTYGFDLPRPTSLNAFDIISFSPGFDLSGLFEERGQDTRFVSGAPATKIIEKLEEIAGTVNFAVRAKDCQVSLDGMKEGGMGPLSIAAEIFELTPELVVVEVKRKAGDRGEYEEFFNKRLKPGLQNLVYDGSTGKIS
ncbi:CBL-interacting serine/threonine-protein kinase 12 [Ananas comosus]|uniref:non-specific serine/threonine protein kinase n=1 Tax=Ananas comosus TaxID=4615 RepID=A0A199VZ34_ANACO|nr:CBL-interacting serine/threonine-protein kinase 12 [Ananas comosus]